MDDIKEMFKVIDKPEKWEKYLLDENLVVGTSVLVELLVPSASGIHDYECMFEKRV